MVTNPPYGERIGDPAEMGGVYSAFGDQLRRQWLGWDCWILTVPALVKRLGLRASRRIELFNGPIDCRLAHLPISTEAPTGEPPRRG
jgi:putative N6-adenine-specific DNA methylase